MTQPTITLATLIRGKTYSFNTGNGTYVSFGRNVPKPVPDDVADQLEELVEEIGTDDGDPIEVERFRIERNVPASRVAGGGDDDEAPVRIRTRLVREAVPVRKTLPVRKVPTVGKPKPSAGFGRRNTGE